MDINIGKFNLTSDKFNVTVQERYEKEDGSEGLRFIGFYGSVQAALQGLSKVVDKQSDAKTINKWLDDIERYKKDIEQLIASVDFDTFRIESSEDLSFLD